MNKIQRLHKNGTMAFLVKKGLITPTAYRRLEIFVEVKNLEHQGVKRSHAVEVVAEKCRYSPRGVWRSLREFSTDKIRA